ncbi:hypothetical protein [Gloeocapsopsis sp. IPPAS B-1203]|nr:hypothetical protein [Gloeocapsopsis sp. IPPAS B-1203]
MQICIAQAWNNQRIAMEMRLVVLLKAMSKPLLLELFYSAIALVATG